MTSSFIDDVIKEEDQPGGEGASNNGQTGNHLRDRQVTAKDPASQSSGAERHFLHHMIADVTQADVQSELNEALNKKLDSDV